MAQKLFYDIVRGRGPSRWDLSLSVFDPMPDFPRKRRKTDLVVKLVEAGRSVGKPITLELEINGARQLGNLEEYRIFTVNDGVVERKKDGTYRVLGRLVECIFSLRTRTGYVEIEPRT